MLKEIWNKSTQTKQKKRKITSNKVNENKYSLSFKGWKKAKD